jgi:hypothetical protein
MTSITTSLGLHCAFRPPWSQPVDVERTDLIFIPEKVRRNSSSLHHGCWFQSEYGVRIRLEL